MVKLGKAEMVLLQFSFSNSEAIPSVVRMWSTGGEREANEKQTTKSGVMVIDNKEQVDLSGVSSLLEDESYQLVDVFYESREAVNRKNSTARFYTVRFTFVSGEQHPPLMEKNSELLTALECLCEEAFWAVRVFENPFYRDGVEIQSKTMVSINMVARLPRYNNEGNPVTARRRSVDGRKIGEPVPLEPLHNLNINNGELSVDLCIPAIA